MPAQDYEIDQSGHLVVVSIATSQLSGAQMQHLAEDLLDHMRNDEARLFVLDMAAVEYIDSACVGALVEFLQEIEHVRGRIALAHCQANVEFLFKVTKLDKVFKMHEDVHDACAAMAEI